MLAAIGVNPYRPGDKELESTDYLTAARRRQLIVERDRLASLDE
jgi:hypothetical protein